MPIERRQPPAKQAPDGMLTIGALSRATGIPVETLRTWELRYGFPVPQRKPSGHRVYPVSIVQQLRRIAEALARGHRAAQVVGVSERSLAQLIESSRPAQSSQPPAPGLAAFDPADLIEIVEAFDAERLTQILLADWARLGPIEFLRARIAPTIQATELGWETGRLHIRHEHFLSERLGDLLRLLRLPYEERATGPLVVLATLSGEAHSLGLQMATMVLAVAGCRILYLGTQIPVPELVALAKDLHARAAGVSISLANRGAAMTTQLARLRHLLPKRVTLLVGGAGAPRPRPGLEVFHDLASLDTWSRSLLAAGGSA